MEELSFLSSPKNASQLSELCARASVKYMRRERCAFANSPYEARRFPVRGKKLPRHIVCRAGGAVAEIFRACKESHS
jgi:hypothetical protein